MNTGTLTWFDASRGLGFITPDDGGPDVFVHASCVVASGMPAMLSGQRFDYEVEPDERSQSPYAALLLEAA